MIEDYPILPEIPSQPYLDVELSVGNYYEDDSFGGEGGGGGYNFLIDSNNIYNHVSDGSMIQSNGYIFADYNRDKIYDQVWRGDASKGWETCVGGGLRWVKGDGPVEEMEELDQSKP